LFESNRVSFANFQIKPEKNRKELEKEEKAAGITSAQVQKKAMAHLPSSPNRYRTPPPLAADERAPLVISSKQTEASTAPSRA
jgi:hypothetical protein